MPFKILITISFLLSFLTTTTAFAFVPSPTRTFHHVSFSPTSSVTSVQMADGPAVLDRPETIENVDEDEKTEGEARFDNSGWEIRLVR
jgi:hypothetical protein